MKKSKVFSVVTSATLAAAMLLTGCGSNDTPASTASSSAPASSEAAASGEATGGEESNLLPALSAEEMGQVGNCTIPRSEYVKYPIEGAEGITLTYWMPVPGNVMKNPETSDSVQMTEWAKEWQELTGVKVEFVGPTASNDEAFNLMSVSTELPDIVEWEWANAYPGGPAGAEADGLVTYLNDYITPDGPAADLWQWLQDNPHMDKAIKDDNGNYYCFPFVRGSKYLQCTSGILIRKDFLDQIGWKAEDIKTIDDWTEVLTAFKEMGIEKPLTSLNMSNLMQAFASPYFIREGMYLSHTDGKVHYGPMEEGYKEWMKQMNEWVKAGLLDAELVANDGNKEYRETNMLNGVSGACYGAGGGQLGTWNNAAWAKPEVYGEDYELVATQFPVLKEGDPIKYSGGSYDYATTSKAHASITADCEYPEIAAAFLNFCYSKAGHYAINFGTEGVSYTLNEDGSTSYTDEVMKNPDGLAVAAAMAKYGRGNMSGAFVQDPDYIFNYYESQQQKDALHIWNDGTDAQSTIIPPITMTKEEADEYAKLMGDVDITTKEMRARWFNMDGDIDAEWDAYIEQLKGQGIDRMLEIQQAAVDRFNAR